MPKTTNLDIVLEEHLFAFGSRLAQMHISFINRLLPASFHFQHIQNNLRIRQTSLHPHLAHRQKASSGP